MQHLSMGFGQTCELIYSRHSPHQTLENLAARALAENDIGSAFKFADRRCRIAPPPLAHCYVLRAEAAYKLGDKAAALADLATALKISPHDTAALRRLLAWGNDADRDRAASSLILEEQDTGILRASIEVLARVGRHRLAAASVYDTSVTGWAVWDSDQVAEISLAAENSTLTHLLSPDPFHPLSRHPVRASAFCLPRSSSNLPQMLSISVKDESFFQSRLPPNAKNGRSPRKSYFAIHSDPRPNGPPTIIVPVYADANATKACINGLITDDPFGKKYRVLIVDDASPEPAISNFLKSLSSYSHVDVLTNPINLGFVGSVNRALAQLHRCDVILLNADTLVPPGFIDRLAATARTSPEIGTVVPLSNNSEISDFPISHHNNRLGTRGDVIRLDRIAASCNHGEVVDLPNGTGFCLYITRACLDALGGLSENFHRGYLEDIDFCLRARERGFRNVCAPSVYVGHAGSRSFKAEKRSLVVRNLGVLDHRFPLFRTECAAFAASDPLRPARQALERKIPPAQKRPTLLFSGLGPLRAAAQHRAHQLLLEGKSAILLEIVSEDGARKIRFAAADDSTPQSICIGFSTEDDLRDLQDYLTRLHPSHCEIFDISLTPPSLIRSFATMKLPFDLWVADGTLAQLQPARRGKKTIKVAASSPQHIWPAATDSSDSISLDDLVTAARRMLVSCPMAEAFAIRTLSSRKTKLARLPSRHAVDLSLAQSRHGPPTLAIVPARSSSGEFFIIRHIAHLMRRGGLQASILVAGATLDDLRLMSHENVFVTGKIEPAELGGVLQAHNVRWMLTGFDQPLFGHPLTELVRAADIPVAYLDWSTGATRPRPGDLAIRPDGSPEQVATEVNCWIGGS
ncbi:MAG: glycosyltransferase [Devosia sp.]